MANDDASGFHLRGELDTHYRVEIGMGSLDPAIERRKSNASPGASPTVSPWPI